MLFRGLGRFLPCLSPLIFSPYSSILLLVFLFTEPLFFRCMILFSFIHFVSICSSRILYVYLTGSNCQKGQEKEEVIEGAERLCWRAFYFCTANSIGILIPWYVFPRKFSFFLKFIAVFKKHPFPTSLVFTLLANIPTRIPTPHYILITHVD